MTDNVPQPVPSPAEWTSFVQAIAAGVQPLAHAQAESQQRAIEADLQKHKASLAAAESSARRTWWLAMVALAIIGAAIWKFIDAGQFNIAYNALSFASGAALGFGLGRSRN